jgi:hypothetical protein
MVIEAISDGIFVDVDHYGACSEREVSALGIGIVGSGK